MTDKNYIIEKAEGRQQLMEKVNKRIEEGYWPHGDLQVDKLKSSSGLGGTINVRYVYFQAMVRRTFWVHGEPEAWSG